VRFVGLRLASAVLVALAALATAGSLAGCGSHEHVGRRCELGTNVTNDGSGAEFLISQPVSDCPSGICLGPAPPTDFNLRTGPLCTAGCESNDDCENAESADPNDASDTRCQTGFVCMWPTTVGILACRKLCVCRDFVAEPPGGFQEPAVCR
jgi:hypothetical protein